MNLVLGQDWLAPELPPPDAVLERSQEVALLLEMRDTLQGIQAAILGVPQPQVQDLTELTQAVTALKPDLSAEQIGAAVAAAIRLPEPQTIDLSALGEVSQALSKLDFRMKGTGGGGSLSPDITDRGSRLLGQVTNTYADSLSKSAYCTTYASSGNHDAITPGAGRKIRLLYVTFTPSSDNTLANTVSVGFGTAGGSIAIELYRAYAAGHGTPFEGNPDQSVIVNTATAEAVAFTAHYQEIA
jgi:hypothetical protein